MPGHCRWQGLGNSFPQGKEACRVVNEGHHQVRGQLTAGQESHELGSYLEEVDVGFPGTKLLDES